MQRCLLSRSTSFARTLATSGAASRHVYPILTQSCRKPILSEASASLLKTHIQLRSLHIQSTLRQAAAEQVVSDEPAQRQDGPITRFDELLKQGLVHPNIARVILDDMQHEVMTEVQAKTINEALRGDDIVAQAKTGTGKTIGFLLPILQRIITSDPQLANAGYRRPRTTPDDIRAIIISPTRELAEQIAAEARRLVRNTSMVVQCAVGGTAKIGKLREMQRDGCHILVGTPGRLNDVFSDSYSGVSAPALEAFVLDEADRLLDAGFWMEIQQFMRHLPDRDQQDRQTMMFSATMPPDVQDMVLETLKPQFKVIQTVSRDEEPTHERVEQHKVVVASMANSIPTLLELCMRLTKEAQAAGARPFKAIVYSNITKEVVLLSELFRGLRDPSSSAEDNSFGMSNKHPLFPARIFEMHAKLTQGQRDRTTQSFRQCKTGIMFSSDVTARGMDFPDVTHVIQLGMATTREAYIHRLGRTARAGKEGEGWLITPSIENYNLRVRARGLRMSQDNSLAFAKAELARPDDMGAEQQQLLTMLVESAQRVDRAVKADAYRSAIGATQNVGDKQGYVDELNETAQFAWGMSSPPNINRRLADKLGLARIRGISYGEEAMSALDVADAERQSRMSRGRTGGSGPSRGNNQGFESRSRDAFASSDRGNGGFSRSPGGRGGFERRGGYGDDRGGSRESRGRFGGRGGDRGDRGDRSGGSMW